jgi:phage tail sheath gpL-like
MPSENISFDQIPSSIRKPGKYFEFNTKLAVRTLPWNRQELLIVGQRLAAFIEAATVEGAGLNDLTSGGTFTGLVTRKMVVQIDGTGTPDTFKWSKDGGNSWDAETVAITGAAQALTEGITITFGATTGHTSGDKWYFTAYVEPSVAEKVPTVLFSDVEAAGYFGYGSQAHLMAKAAIEANPYVALSACTLNDAVAGVAGSGSLTIDAAAVASGTQTARFGNQSVQTAVVKDDTPAEMAQALAIQMQAQPNLPVTGAVDAATPAKINLTAKNKGVVGNSIPIAYEVTNAATTATIVAMASGSGDPDVNDALAEVVSEQYHLIATPYNDQTSLETLRTHLDLVSGPLEQRPSVGVYGHAGALADATTLAGNVNHGRILGAYLRNTKSLPLEIASAMASVLAFEEDPARPLNTLELKKIHAPAIDDRLSRTEQESCLYNGVAPLEVGPDEKVQIVRAISTYIKDGGGIDDISLLDITTIRTLDYVRKACRERVALRFPREKLSTKTPPKVKSELLDVLFKLEDLEIVEEVDVNKDGLVVEKDLQDPNRLDAKIPVDVVNGLHVFAGRIDLLL